MRRVLRPPACRHPRLRRTWCRSDGDARSAHRREWRVRETVEARPSGRAAGMAHPGNLALIFALCETRRDNPSRSPPMTGEVPATQPNKGNRRAIPATCQTQTGTRGFRTLTTRLDGVVVVTGRTVQSQSRSPAGRRWSLTSPRFGSRRPVGPWRRRWSQTTGGARSYGRTFSRACRLSRRWSACRLSRRW